MSSPQVQPHQGLFASFQWMLPLQMQYWFFFQTVMMRSAIAGQIYVYCQTPDLTSLYLHGTIIPYTDVAFG